jgi:hypothetical protein
MSIKIEANEPTQITRESEATPIITPLTEAEIFLRSTEIRRHMMETEAKEIPDFSIRLTAFKASIDAFAAAHKDNAHNYYALLGVSSAISNPVIFLTELSRAHTRTWGSVSNSDFSSPELALIEKKYPELHLQHETIIKLIDTAYATLSNKDLRALHDKELDSRTTPNVMPVVATPTPPLHRPEISTETSDEESRITAEELAELAKLETAKTRKELMAVLQIVASKYGYRFPSKVHAADVVTLIRATDGLFVGTTIPDPIKIQEYIKQLPIEYDIRQKVEYELLFIIAQFQILASTLVDHSEVMKALRNLAGIGFKFDTPRSEKHAHLNDPQQIIDRIQDVLLKRNTEECLSYLGYIPGNSLFNLRMKTCYEIIHRLKNGERDKYLKKLTTEYRAAYLKYEDQMASQIHTRSLAQRAMQLLRR